MPADLDPSSGEWVAMYMPATQAHDPSRAFASEGAAWEFVFGSMCASCRREREIALGAAPTPEERAAYREHGVSEFPACAWEWEVIPMAEYVELGEAAAGVSASA